MKELKCIFIISILVIGTSHLYSQNISKGPQIESIIFDTDMGPDYDDVGALAVLHAFADSNYVDILATVSSNKMEKTTQLINLINTYFNRPDIPIGVTKDPIAKNNDTWHKGVKWTEELLKQYPYHQAKASMAEDAVKVYRKVLAQQTDHSVTIVTVGFFTNLKNLLLSPPDGISNMAGKELVARKVKKLVSMACRFPKGREYNAYADAKSTKYVVENWPSTIVLSGAEIGRYIRTGDKMIACSEDSPIKEAYRIAIPQDRLEFENSRYEMGGRASYDQTTVVAAVLGNKFFDMERGNVLVEEDGSNTWEVDPTGKHVILKHKYSFQEMADIIEGWMMHKPIKK